MYEGSIGVGSSLKKLTTTEEIKKKDGEVVYHLTIDTDNFGNVHRRHSLRGDGEGNEHIQQFDEKNRIISYSRTSGEFFEYKYDQDGTKYRKGHDVQAGYATRKGYNNTLGAWIEEEPNRKSLDDVVTHETNSEIIDNSKMIDTTVSSLEDRTIKTVKETYDINGFLVHTHINELNKVNLDGSEEWEADEEFTEYDSQGRLAKITSEDSVARFKYDNDEIYNDPQNDSGVDFYRKIDDGEWKPHSVTHYALGNEMKNINDTTIKEAKKRAKIIRGTVQI